MKTHSREKDLETAATLAAAALVFHFVFKAAWLPWLALALLVLGLFFKRAASLLAAAWLGFAHVLGEFNGRLLLGLVYFLVVTPMGFAFRLFKKDPLGLKRDAAAPTYFRDRTHSYSPADFEKGW